MLIKSAILMSLVVMAALVIPSASRPVHADGGFTLTILHNNDASSRLLNRGPGLEDFGGIARFKTVVDIERTRAASGPNAATVVLSAGNTIEVGPYIEASVARGSRFYDATGMRAIGYDAAILGPQDFGLGPDVLASFLCGFVGTGKSSILPACDATGPVDFPFLAANLSFEHEPNLQALVDAGFIANSTIITKREHRIGVVGVTTPNLSFVSSPRNTIIRSNIVPIVQREIDKLESQGVNRIIVLAQLQGIDADVDLVAGLRGVDVLVTGGTGSQLSTSTSTLVPGDRYAPTQQYPQYATSESGKQVPIVTVGGAYSYLGKLVVEFDSAGEIVGVDPGSGPIRVAGLSQSGGVSPDTILENAITRPVQAFLDALASDVVATSAVALDGRMTVIRSQETNLGNLMADAALWQARELAASFGVPTPDIAVLNAGGMRLDGLRPAGPLSHLETYEIAPFSSFISVVEDVSAADLKLLMENALANVPGPEARFAQIAGFSVTFNPAAEALDFDAGGERLNEGARVLSIQLDDGTYLVRDGVVVPGAPSVTVATIDFLAQGGDQYPFQGRFTNLGVSYQQALERYLTEALGGTISATQYPEGGSGRIVAR